ncbi:MAG TPA: FkbM family methyltransferase [Edaphobacter sp.]|nr:FkbM family methyltransferase [Edaphobacter sp.]
MHVIDRVTSNPAGRAAFKAVQPVIHLMRRMAHPNLPNELTASSVSYGERQFSIVHRRWSETDQLAIDQCFKQRQYDMPVGAHGILINNLYQEILAAGRKPLIVDCGANIGTSVLWFSGRYPKAHIVAIEPAPDNFNLLMINSAGLDIDCRHAGISGTDGRAYIECEGSPMGYRTNYDAHGMEIEMVSLPTILASKPDSQYTPFLLKIDIEGAERDLFHNDAAAFNRFPLIIFEPHDWLLPGQLSSREFFRFHADAGREFCMNHENVASIAPRESLLNTKGIKLSQ